MNPSVQTASLQLREAIREATHGLINREHLAELMILAAVANEHLLVIGPPGTAKSAVVRRRASPEPGRTLFRIPAGAFHRTVRAVRPGQPGQAARGPGRDRRRRHAARSGHRLPRRSVPRFDRDPEHPAGRPQRAPVPARPHATSRCPLRICVGAANALPDDEGLAAFADRFLLHVFVDAVPDARLEDLLRRRLADGPAAVAPRRRDWPAWTCSTAPWRRSTWPPCAPTWPTPFASCVRPTFTLSDRRIVSVPSGWSPPPTVLGRARARERGPTLWPLLYRGAHRGGPGTVRAKRCARCWPRRSHPLLQAVAEGTAAQQPLARVARLVGDRPTACWAEARTAQAAARSAWRPCCARSTPISTNGPAARSSWRRTARASSLHGHDLAH